MEEFSREIRNLADKFVDTQRKRNEADYNPEVPGGRWHKSDIAEDIDTAQDAIERFEAAPLQERRAFAISVLLKNRKS